MKLSEPLDIRQTTRRELCCGCGVCSVTCPKEVIQISLNADLEYRPRIALNGCDQCGRCLAICPFSTDAIRAKDQKISRRQDFGLGPHVGLYQGSAPGEGYKQSASGGLLTKLLQAMLERGEIDCVIHAEALAAKGDDAIYFRASLSRNVPDLERKRSSVYAPVEFSTTLRSALADPMVSSCCLVGVPCAVMAVARLRQMDGTAAAKIKYLFSLACSHNVSGQFGLKLLDDFGVNACESKLSFRDKNGIESKDDFNICVTPEGQRPLRRPRSSTSFTGYWRSYAYAWNSCLYCADFFGSYADGTFKDAWGLPAHFSADGETVTIIRSERLKALLHRLRDTQAVKVVPLNPGDLVQSQFETLQFKSILAPLRLRRLLPDVVGRLRVAWPLRVVHRIEFALLRLTVWWSKRRFRKYRMFLPKFYIRGVSRVLGILRRMRQIITRVNRNRQGRSDRFTVICAAGFGYDNLGDEAQLHSNLMNWERLKVGCRIIILSPNPDSTCVAHGSYEVAYAPRRTWWSAFGLDYCGIGERVWYLPVFLLKLGWVLSNAFLYKHTGLTFMAPTSAYLLYLLRSANVLHLGGGGYLTGKTASRLYDNMALILLANYFDTDVILSGHTIGIWQNPLQKLFARQLRKARVIGLRDGEGSIRDLRTIEAYDPAKVRVLFDDALFCPPTDAGRWQVVLAQYGLQNHTYVALHVHYWKIPRARVNAALDRLAGLLDEIYAEHALPYLLIPMVSSYHEAMAYLSWRMSAPVHLLDCQGDFRMAIAAFQGAKLCITMKHHPIIFSMAGAVPTVSLAFDEYYFHKNYGALALFGQERFVVEDDSLADGRFKATVTEALRDATIIAAQIRAALEAYRADDGAIIRQYLEFFELARK